MRKGCNSVSLLMAVVIAIMTSVVHVNGDFLSDYLDRKTFGDNPGPCTAQDPCEGDVTNLSPSTLAIEVCITDTICGPLGDYLKQGSYKIWDLKCSEISVDDITVSSTSFTSGAEPTLTADLGVDTLKLSCTFQADLGEQGNYVVIKPFTDDSRFQVTFSTKDSTFSFIKSDQPDGTQIQSQLELAWQAPENNPAIDIPSEIRLPVDQCDISPDFGLSVELEPSGNDFEYLEVCGDCLFFTCCLNTNQLIGGAILNIFNWNNILEIIANILEGLIGAITCQILEEAALLNAGEPDQEDGTLNILWEEFRQSIFEYDDSKADDLDEADTDEFIRALYADTLPVTDEMFEKAFDFSNSTTAELISVGLNNWLGVGTREDANKLVINEVIELLTDPDGYYLSGDISGDEIQLEALDASVADITIRLDQFQIRGLNTFNIFNVFQNGYGEDQDELKSYRRTFNNTLELENIDLYMKIYVLLERGEWVSESCNLPASQENACESDSSEFTFDFSISMEKVFVELAINTLFDLEQIYPLQLGQILQLDRYEELDDTLYWARHCLAAPFYTLFAPSLEISVADISDPVVENFDGEGLSSLIENTIQLISDAAKGALESKLPNLAQGPAREYLNDSIRDFFLQIGRNRGIAYCPRYIVDIDEPAIVDIDFQDGVIASRIYSFINDAFGGDPIVNTNSDVNELVDTILKFYEVKIDGFLLDSWDNTTEPPTRFPLGYWELPDEYQNSMKVPKFNDTSGENFFWFTDFSVDNVNSIYRLTAAPELEQIDKGMNVQFGLGGTLVAPGGVPEEPSPLLFNFSFQYSTDEGVDEEWDFFMTVKEVDFGFVVNEVRYEQHNMNLLTVEKLLHLPCSLQTVDRILFPQDNRQSSIEDLDFTINPVRTQGEGTGNRLVDALHGIKGDLAVDDGSDRFKTQRRFRGLINSVFFAGLNYGLDVIEDIPDSYEDVTSNNCLAVEDPFASTSVVFDLGLPNVTYFSEVCLAPLPTSRLSVQQVEDQFVTGYNSDTDDVYNWQTSTGAELLQGALKDTSGTGSQSTLDNILFGLANSTGESFLDKYFLPSTGPDGEPAVDLLVDLSLFGFITDEALSDAIPGLVLDGGQMLVSGVNRITRDFEILNPVGEMTLNNKIAFTEDNPLIVNVTSIVRVDKEAVNETGVGLITETIVTDMVITGLNLEFDLVVAIDEELFGNLSLAHFFRVDAAQEIFIDDHAVYCFLSTIFEGGIFLSYLDVEIDEIDGPTLRTLSNELISPGIEEFMDALLEVMKGFYFEAIPNICQNCLRTFINDYLLELYEDAKKPYDTSISDKSLRVGCPALEQIDAPPLSEENKYYRFNNATDFLYFQELIEEYLRPDDFATLNVLIDKAFQDPTLFNAAVEEQIRFAGIPVLYDGVSYGSIDLQLANMDIEGLNSFIEFKLFEPYFLAEEDDDDSRRRLSNGRSLETLNVTQFPDISAENIPYMTLTKFVLSQPLEITAEYDFNATDFFVTMPDMKNNLRIKITLDNVNFGLMLRLKVDIERALNVRFSSISSVDELPCLFVPVDELVPEQFNFTTTGVGIDIECLRDCDLFADYGLERGSSLNNDNAGLLSDLLNELIKYATAYVSSRGAQSAIDAFIASAELNCNKILGLIDDSITPSESILDNIFQTFGIIFLGGAGFAGALTLSLFPLHKKRRQRIMAKTLAKHKAVTSDSEMAGIMAMTELSMKSIFQHPITNNAAKYIVPVICILNVVGLVIAIVFSDAANIVISFTILGQTTQQIALVPFTVVSTINDMWNSGAWPLAILIAVASCAWPIVKNLLLLGLWFTPSTVVRAHTRRYWLEVLDLLGKWSFLDVYVIVIMLAALRTYVSASFLSFIAFLPDNFFVTDVNVTPESGIIILCFVAGASLLINHVIIVFHDRVEKSNNDSEDKINGNYTGSKIPARAAAQRRVAQHTFVGKDKEGRVRKVSPKAAIALLVMAFIAFVSIVIGLTLPIITFEFDGLVGLLLETLEENNQAGTVDLSENYVTQLSTKTYSVISMGAALSDSPAPTAWDRIVLIFFQLLYFMCTTVGALFCIITSVMLFVLPMNLPRLKSLLFWTKISFYWSAIEVLLVGLIATIIEIQQVTDFIIQFITNNICGQLEAAIAVFVEDGDTDGTCLNVIGSFEPTVGVLFVGVVFQLITFYVITVLTRAVISDRYYVAYRDLRNDVKPKKLSRLQRLTIRLFTRTQVSQVDGIEGEGAFVGLDGVENDAVEIEETMCDKLSEFCCSTASGEAQADERIMQWQAKFGVGVPTDDGSPTVSSNPVFGRESGSSSNSDSIDVSARVRAESDDSILV